MTLAQTALVISGNLRPSETVTQNNKDSFGFGAGRGHVVAAMTGSLFSAGGKHEVLGFNAEIAMGKREPAVPPKIAAARNAAIASVITTSGGSAERLSPDVEGPARRLGRAIGERVLAFAKEQGWMEAAPAEAALGKPEMSSPSEEQQDREPASDSSQTKT